MAEDEQAGEQGTSQEPLSALPVLNSALIEEDIYGAAFVSFIQDLNAETGVFSGNLLSISRMVWTMGILIINLIVQVFTLVCVDNFIVAPTTSEARKTYQSFHDEVFIDGVFDEESWESFEGKDHLCQISFAQPAFITTILFIWIITTARELRTTAMQARTNLLLPTVYRIKDAHETNEDDEFVILGLTSLVRVVVFVLIYIPKFCIGLLLLWMGLRWLTATTSFADLILNCLALVFVIELDELFYSALIPHSQKEQVASTQVKITGGANNHFAVAFHLQKGDDWRQQIVPYIRCIAWAIGCIFVTLLYIYEFQMVLPDYQYDVQDACIQWYAQSWELSTMHMMFGGTFNSNRHNHGIYKDYAGHGDSGRGHGGSIGGKGGGHSHRR